VRDFEYFATRRFESGQALRLQFFSFFLPVIFRLDIHLARLLYGIFAKVLSGLILTPFLLCLPFRIIAEGAP
jgi:hypothetical protein